MVQLFEAIAHHPFVAVFLAVMFCIISDWIYNMAQLLRNGKTEGSEEE
jgi:hypothetical protein